MQTRAQRRKFTTATAALMSMCLAAASCAPVRPDPATRTEAAASAPVKADDHAVHAGNLHRLMLEIEMYTLEKLPGTFQSEADRRKRFEEIRAAANTLAQAAVEIPLEGDALNLDDEGKRQFRTMSAGLRSGALALADRANAEDLGSVYEEIDSLLAHCNACHSQFRIEPMDPSATHR